MSLRLLEEFVSREGRPPRQRESVTVAGAPVHIGKWLMHQRQRPENLSQEQADALTAALEGVPVSRSDTWSAQHALLDRFVRDSGRLPMKGEVVNGLPLGQWVRDQRKAHSRGSLSAERVAQLEAVDGWTWAPNEAAFEEGLVHLRVYVEKHGTGWVPVRYVAADGFPLGSWCRQQRMAAASAPPEQTAALKAAGLVFDTPPIRERPRAAAERAPVPRRRRAAASE